MSSARGSRAQTESGGVVSAACFERTMAPFALDPTAGPIAIAVSGGPDSMALVRLAKEWADIRGASIVGLTVDHQLRPEAEAEAEQVSRWLNSLGIEHHVLEWEHGARVRRIARSAQNDARTARFDLLCTWCERAGAQAWMTAHHADDQVETFLDRLIRGSGLDGLAAMAPDSRRHGVRILRPLLEFTKQDLIETCAKFGQACISDPSNEDSKYKRVRMRRLLIAFEQEGLDRSRILKTVGHMRRAKQAIDSAVDKLSLRAINREKESAVRIDVGRLISAPHEVGLRCLARCLADISGEIYAPRFDSLTAVYDALAHGAWSDRTLHGCHLQVRDGVLVISVEPGRK